MFYYFNKNGFIPSTKTVLFLLLKRFYSFFETYFITSTKQFYSCNLTNFFLLLPRWVEGRHAGQGVIHDGGHAVGGGWRLGRHDARVRHRGEYPAPHTGHASLRHQHVSSY